MGPDETWEATVRTAFCLTVTALLHSGAHEIHPQRRVQEIQQSSTLNNILGQQRDPLESGPRF